MFDFPVHVKHVNDVPDNFQNLYVTTEEGCSLIEELAVKFTADTDDKIIETLTQENGALQQSLLGFREHAETSHELEQKLKSLNTQLGDLGSQLETRDQEVSALSIINGTYMMEEKATQAIAKAKGNIALLKPHVLNFLEILNVDGVRQVQVKETKEIVDGDRDTLPISVEDLVLKLKDDPSFSAAFNTNPVTGGGMSPVQSGRNSRHLNPTDQKSINSKIEEIAAGKITVSM